MDPTSIAILIGLATLVVERIFSVANKIKSSKCCGGSIEFKNSVDKNIVDK